MPRRSALAALPGLVAAATAGAAAADEWRLFRDRFLTPEGRLLDTGNGGVSHSEGQGWGLMFAAAFDDRPAFDRILAWTQRVLKRRTDHLHAWRYRPGAVPAVADPNNATDGDLYIAFGLLMAQARWRHAPYRTLAVAIGRDLLRLTLRETAGGPTLLPGAGGFESADGMVLNPSYLVLPAFAALAEAMPGDRWPAIAQESLALLQRARFGAWGLSPDWVLLPRSAGAPLRMPPAWPPRFSFDAVRVPLSLAWAGAVSHPALLGALAFWSDPRWTAPPAWVDLVTGNTADFAASPGMRAIAAFAQARIAGPGATATLPSVNASGDYYSASLTILARVACGATGVEVA
ncbi:glycosyl hydrolase family 8 [Roseomonas sp. CAU 1739]|uniref:glycosyl hydrolase family 8 n=1 Tax=Roseomonas sp. CAU 1739 TaxID=3140364 RepID=UPI00325B72E3